MKGFAQLRVHQETFTCSTGDSSTSDALTVALMSVVVAVPVPVQVLADQSCVRKVGTVTFRAVETDLLRAYQVAAPEIGPAPIAAISILNGEPTATDVASRDKTIMMAVVAANGRGRARDRGNADALLHGIVSAIRDTTTRLCLWTPLQTLSAAIVGHSLDTTRVIVPVQVVATTLPADHIETQAIALHHVSMS
mmetsp:Transcript_25723/g.37976  ORF Transcript_25723/g.37976 Transcript_25723/m.37976 type:complete len:194 (+) Transcript_25723:1307-1888(+)